MADPQAPVTLDMSKSVPLSPQTSSGVTLDMSKSVPVQQGPSMMQNIMSAGKGVAKGFLEGAGQTGQSMVHATDYVGNKIGDVIGLPGHASAMDMTGTGPAGQGEAIMNNLTTPTTTAEKVGVGAESIAEFVLGDEALKSLSLGEKLMKGAKLAETYEKASPMARAVIEAGMNATRQGAASAVEAKAKGATNAEAIKEGLTTGAISGGSEAISGGMKMIGEAIDAPMVEYVRNRAVKLAESQGAPQAIVDMFRSAPLNDVKDAMTKITQSGQTASTLVSTLGKPAASIAMLWAANKFLPESLKLPFEIAIGAAGLKGFEGLAKAPGAIGDALKGPALGMAAHAATQTATEAASKAAPAIGRAVAAGQVGYNAATTGDNAQPVAEGQQ